MPGGDATGFGESLALAGDTAIVGAYKENMEKTKGQNISGAAYIYQR